jgi:hypothetical protein
MTELKRPYILVVTAIFAATILSSPLPAQTGPADLEALIGPSLEIDSGIALARRQIAGGDLPGAIATLERVTIAHPEAAGPRLLHIALLCRLDDREGADVELGQLGGTAIPDDLWAEVTAACGAVQRPAPPRGSRR